MGGEAGSVNSRDLNTDQLGIHRRLLLGIPMKSSNKKRYRARVVSPGFEGAAIGAAAVSGANLLESKADATTDGNYPATSSQRAYDFTNQSGALQPDTIVNSACQFCNSLCRLKVHLKDGRIIDVLGEPDDPVQAGGFCVKGPMMTQRFTIASA